MALKDEILEFFDLHSGEYVSGEELAKRFDKSRAAVWKAIKALQNQGYTIDAVTNKGYCFSKDNDILSVAEIKKHLNFDCKVLVYESIDSTNIQAKRLISDGENGTMLLVAEQQTAGRGRQGKSFYSPAKTGVYMSLIIHPMTELENAVTATTSASVAVCKAIESLTSKNPKIKWVNDIYIDDKKVCGILTEAVTDFETQTVTSVIIGIGTNISTVSFPKDVQNASSIGEKINRAKLVATIANELNKMSVGDYSAFIDYYKEHSMIIGKEIVFIQNGKNTNATAQDITKTGGLVVKLEDGTTKILSSGEITIRKKTV